VFEMQCLNGPGESKNSAASRPGPKAIWSLIHGDPRADITALETVYFESAARYAPDSSPEGKPTDPRAPPAVRLLMHSTTTSIQEPEVDPPRCSSADPAEDS